MKLLFILLCIMYSSIHAGDLLHAMQDINAVQKILNEHPEEIDSQGIAGKSALHIATTLNLYDIAELLIMRGININRRNLFGETALHIAICYARANFVELLLRHKADPSIRDGSGLTAFTIQPGGAFHFTDADEPVSQINNLLAPYKEAAARS